MATDDVSRPARLRARLDADMGGRMREFPAEAILDEAGALSIVLRGAAGSVTALRGLREKVQPILKKAIREEMGGGVKFETVPETIGADMVVRVRFTRL